MINISNHIRTTIGTILANDNVGFNPILQAICTDYNAKPFTIDYSPKSRNFFQGYFGPKVLMNTTNVKFPVQCLYTIRTQNQNTEKFAVFSGAVQLGIDTYISFSKSGAPGEPDALGDAVEDTLINLFNSSANLHMFGNVTYNGDISTTRGPMADDGSNWLQLLQTRLTFDYTAL
jgi:hypothetical protein